MSMQALQEVEGREGVRPSVVPGLADAIEKGRAHTCPAESVSLPEATTVAVFGGGQEAGEAVVTLLERGDGVHVILPATLRVRRQTADTIRKAVEDGRAVLHLHATLKRVAVVGGGPIGLLIADPGPRIVEGVQHLFIRGD